VRDTVHRLKTVGSTQEEARRLLGAGEAAPGDVIVADEQRRGRGRFGRTWISPRGGLYATYILEPQTVPSIRSALAVVRALTELGLETRLKWPNDVLINGRKIAGILVEAVGDVLLVGIGANLAEAPLSTATSALECGVVVGRDALLEAIRRALREVAPLEEVLQTYRARCDTMGRLVRLVRPRVPSVEGVALDVDSEGRLVIQTAIGRVSVASAECEHLESPS